MKKLKTLISALSVMALMCFANSASAQAADYLLTTNAGATYPTQVIQVTTGVLTPLQGSKTLTLTLPANALNNDLNTKALGSTSGADIVVNTNGSNQITIEVAPTVNLRDLGNHFYNNGIAISKEILLQLQ